MKLACNPGIVDPFTVSVATSLLPSGSFNHDRKAVINPRGVPKTPWGVCVHPFILLGVYT